MLRIDELNDVVSQENAMDGGTWENMPVDRMLDGPGLTDDDVENRLPGIIEKGRYSDD